MGKRSLRVRSTFTSWQVDAIADAIVVVRVNFDVVASFDDTFSLTTKSNWVELPTAALIFLPPELSYLWVLRVVSKKSTIFLPLCKLHGYRR